MIEQPRSDQAAHRSGAGGCVAADQLQRATCCCAALAVVRVTVRGSAGICCWMIRTEIETLGRFAQATTQPEELPVPSRA